jgi:hypothetical protein
MWRLTLQIVAIVERQWDSVGGKNLRVSYSVPAIGTSEEFAVFKADCFS